MQTIIITSLILAILLLFWFTLLGITSSAMINFGIRALGLHQQRKHIGDTDFHWLESTGKGSVLVMLHGLNGDATNWVLMAPQLKKFRLLIPDLPPFGKSQSMGDGEPEYSMHVQAERLDSLLKHLGIDKFYLAGNSMGGYIAGDYAKNHPEKLLGLLLLSPGGVQSVPMHEHFKADVKAGINPLRVENPEDLERLSAYCFSKQPYLPWPIKRTIYNKMLSISGQCNRIFASMLNDTPKLEDLLANCPIPTLILWGKEDNILNYAGAQTLQEVMLNTKIILPEKTGHVPMLEYPKATGLSMAGFINDLETTQPD